MTRYRRVTWWIADEHDVLEVGVRVAATFAAFDVLGHIRSLGGPRQEYGVVYG